MWICFIISLGFLLSWTKKIVHLNATCNNNLYEESRSRNSRLYMHAWKNPGILWLQFRFCKDNDVCYNSITSPSVFFPLFLCLFLYLSFSFLFFSFHFFYGLLVHFSWHAPRGNNQRQSSRLWKMIKIREITGNRFWSLLWFKMIWRKTIWKLFNISLFSQFLLFKMYNERPLALQPTLVINKRSCKWGKSCAFMLYSKTWPNPSYSKCNNWFNEFV